MLLSTLALTAVPAAAFVKLALEPHGHHNLTRLQRRADNNEDMYPELQAQGVMVGTKSGFWKTNITVGTPPQEIAVAVSFNWGDTFLSTRIGFDCADIFEDPDVCAQIEQYTQFDVNASSTFKYNQSQGEVEEFYYYNSMMSYSISDASYGSDNITVGKVHIEDFKLAVPGEHTEFLNSILGLGNRNLETTMRTDDAYNYPNFVGSLKESGLISTEAFSVYFPSQFSNNGEILFGAIDHAKYFGNLTTLPYSDDAFWWDYRKQNGPAVTTTQIGYHINNTSGTFTTSPHFQTFLWYDSPITYFPEQLITELEDVFGFQKDTKHYWYTSCSLLTSSFENYIVINFQGTPITFPIADLYYYKDSDETLDKCYLAFASGQDGEIRLGANMLKNTYVVMHQEKYEISVAQVRFTEKSDIEEINGGEVPGAVSAKDYTVTFDYDRDALTSTSGRNVFSLVTTTYDASELGYTGTYTLPTNGAQFEDVDVVTKVLDGTVGDDEDGDESSVSGSTTSNWSSHSSEHSSADDSSSSESSSIGESIDSSTNESTTDSPTTESTAESSAADFESTSAGTSSASSSSSSSSAAGSILTVGSGLFAFFTILTLIM